LAEKKAAEAESRAAAARVVRDKATSDMLSAQEATASGGGGGSGVGISG
jgi:hypothetical protein